MIVRVLYPRDSKHLAKGFETRDYVVPREVLVSFFDEYRRSRNFARAVDVICGYVAGLAAEEWCRAVGAGRRDDCIVGYLDKQGERIREQCEVAVRAWVVHTAECLRQCGRDFSCFEKCYYESSGG